MTDVTDQNISISKIIMVLIYDLPLDCLNESNELNCNLKFNNFESFQQSC